ncbi:MAG: Panacea domain-containing protein [Patescibacteria group bacterium]
MKLFYFLDFMHVKKFGSPVTYDNYIKLEHGPIPSAIKNMVDTAEDDVDNSVLSDTIKIEMADGEGIHRIVALRKFTENDKKYFTPTEINILETVVERFGSKNTKFIEDASHNEAPWKETSFMDSIPYWLATHDNDCQVSREEIELMLSI